MKLFNISSELKSLATICSGGDKASGLLLAKLSVDHFHYAPAKAGFQRVQSLLKSRGEIPTYAEIEADPVLNEDYREVLQDSDYKKPLKGVTRIAKLADTMDKYRKLRALHKTAKAIMEALQESSVNVDSVLNDASDNITVARAAVDNTEDMMHIGKGNNSTGIVKTIVDDDSVVPLKRTGFKEFDDKNGGFPDTGVVILCASTSGGKSVMAEQLAINGCGFGESQLVVSLEMDKFQYMSRVLSNLSGVEATKIFRKLLSRKEKKKVKKAYKQFVLDNKKKGIAFTVLAPSHDLTLDQILWTAKPYGYSTITIDYISLLKDANSDQQAQVLGEISRQCKVFATNNHCLIVLLAQLNDDDKIKYSRAIAENADVMWKWRYGEQEKEGGIIDINCEKYRNGATMHFAVKEEFQCMRAIGVESSENEDEDFTDEEDSDDLEA